MHVDVIIPTWNRLKLLRTAVDTILGGTHEDVTVVVVVDGNANILPVVAKWPVAVLFNKQRRDWVYSMNRALRYTMGGAVLYASDDLEFPPDLIEKVVAAMNVHFPNGDGLVGIKTEPTSVQGAFGLMGKKFIEHFPGRQVFCPDFVHYSSDFEIGRYARVHDKFFFCDTATLVHRRLFDETYGLARKARQRDKGIMAQRRGKNLAWGTTFERVVEATK